MSITMSKIFGSSRFQVLLENAEHFEKKEIPCIVRKLIYTTNLPDTPEKHLHFVLNLLEQEMPIYSSYENYSPYDHNNSPFMVINNQTQKQSIDIKNYEFSLDYIINVLLGLNPVYYPKKIDVQSPILVWEIVLELLQRCHPIENQFSIQTELYQKAVDYCRDLIDFTDDETILSCCGLILSYILKRDNYTNKIIFEPFSDEKVLKINRINTGSFQGVRVTMCVLNRIQRIQSINQRRI